MFRDVKGGLFLTFLGIAKFFLKELAPVLFSIKVYHVKNVKVTLLHGCFSCFLNCTNGTKSRKASHMRVFWQMSY